MIPPLVLTQASQHAPFKEISQIIVRLISVIIGDGVVVIGQAHTILFKKSRQDIIHLVFSTLFHAELPVRDQSCAVNVLSVTGTRLPKRSIVVVKHQSTVHQLI